MKNVLITNRKDVHSGRLHDSYMRQMQHLQKFAFSHERNRVEFLNGSWPFWQ